MPETFGDILGRQLHAERAPVLRARTLRHHEVDITEVQSSRPTHDSSGSLPYDDAFVVALQLIDFPKHELSEDGRRAPVTALRAGHMTLYDLRRDPRFINNHAFHSIHFHLPLVMLNTLVREGGRPAIDGLTYTPGVGVDDPVFRHLAMAVKPAFERPAEASRLFVDSVALAVASHVASTYGRSIAGPQRVRGGLSQRQARIAFELIDARLDGALTVAQLAHACGLSTNHFAQAFKQTTGVTPHRWLRNRRTEKAKRLLKQSSMPLGQIALECGFADQSHFTRAFNTVTGSTPGEWRKHSRPGRPTALAQMPPAVDLRVRNAAGR